MVYGSEFTFIDFGVFVEPARQMVCHAILNERSCYRLPINKVEVASEGCVEVIVVRP